VRKNVDQNVVGGGEIKQWAAVKAARSMTREKSLSFVMAPGLGFEPRTNGLTVHCSTAELPRNASYFITVQRSTSAVRQLVGGESYPGIHFLTNSRPR
jgi:hypothetical protein